MLRGFLVTLIAFNSGGGMLAAANMGRGEAFMLLALLLVLGVMAVGFLAGVYLIIRAIVNRPGVTPPTLPPVAVAHNQPAKDREHIKLLAIFHFVFGGLALLGIGFLVMHYAMMHMMLSNPEIWKSQPQAMPPKSFLDMFIWFYLFMGVVLQAGLVLNVLSAFFLLQKRNRLFSLVIGGLNCIQIPFGTALGVFTIMVLSRDSVRQLYGGERGASA
jgi:hypothetical protein